MDDRYVSKLVFDGHDFANFQYQYFDKSNSCQGRESIICLLLSNHDLHTKYDYLQMHDSARLSIAMFNMDCYDRSI
jgi:hypothetical protein